jgi:hypothetical protein
MPARNTGFSMPKRSQIGVRRVIRGLLEGTRRVAGGGLRFPSMTARHLLVVPHTHWDREWYASHEEFRYRLVRLVDRLLAILEGDPAFRCFTLDGQTIVPTTTSRCAPASASASRSSCATAAS